MNAVWQWLIHLPLRRQLWGLPGIGFVFGVGTGIVVSAILPITAPFAKHNWPVLAILLPGLVAAVLLSKRVIVRTTESVAQITMRLSSLEENGLSVLERTGKALAVGQLYPDIAAQASPVLIVGGDELAALGAALNLAIERTESAVGSNKQAIVSLRAMLDEAARVTESACRGDTGARAVNEQFGGAYGQILTGFNRIQDTVHDPLMAALAVLERVAGRDLSMRISCEFQGDHARLASAINGAISNVSDALCKVEVAVEQIAMATWQVNRGSQHIATAAVDQAESIGVVTASIQEHTESTTRIADVLDRARGLSLTMRERLSEGTRSITDLSEAMTRMRRSTGRTRQIVKTIDEIAFQTNLLALNAAVEAARAGDAGRGFAVVAGEVRQLALRAASAARETSELIDETVTTAQDSVALSERVLSRLHAIDTDADRVTSLVLDVSKACLALRDRITLAGHAVGKFAEQTRAVAAFAEESAMAAEELDRQAVTMRDLIRLFMVRDSRGGARTMARRIPSEKPPLTFRERRDGEGPGEYADKDVLGIGTAHMAATV